MFCCLKCLALIYLCCLLWFDNTHHYVMLQGCLDYWNSMEGHTLKCVVFIYKSYNNIYFYEQYIEEPLCVYIFFVFYHSIHVFICWFFFSQFGYFFLFNSLMGDDKLFLNRNLQHKKEYKKSLFWMYLCVYVFWLFYAFCLFYFLIYYHLCCWYILFKKILDRKNFHTGMCKIKIVFK